MKRDRNTFVWLFTVLALLSTIFANCQTVLKRDNPYKGFVDYSGNSVQYVYTVTQLEFYEYTGKVFDYRKVISKENLKFLGKDSSLSFIVLDVDSEKMCIFETVSKANLVLVKDTSYTKDSFLLSDIHITKVKDKSNITNVILETQNKFILYDTKSKRVICGNVEVEFFTQYEKHTTNTETNITTKQIVLTNQYGKHIPIVID